MEVYMLNYFIPLAFYFIPIQHLEIFVCRRNVLKSPEELKPFQL